MSKRAFIQNTGFDAANDTPARSYVTFPESSFDATNQWSRETIVLKSRFLYANIPIYKRIIDKIAQHAIGKGVFVIPTTSDAEWNELAKFAFDEWASNDGVYSIDGSRDLYADQSLSAKELMRDGEFLRMRVLSPNQAPMIQPFDSFELGMGYGYVSRVQGLMRVFDGVKLNRFKRPVSYYIEQDEGLLGYDAGKMREVSANDMIHVFNRVFTNQVRGIPWAASAVNSAVDMMDIKTLITGTAKLHSGLGVVISGSGGVKKNSSDRYGSKDTIDRPEQEAKVTKIFGAQTTYIGDGEKMELLSSDRPSENLMEFLKYLANEIALAFDIPLSTVNQMTGTGTAVRGDLEDAQWLFDMVQDIIFWKHTYPIYTWRVARFVLEGKLPACKDPQWWKCVGRGPAKMTVDAGRTAMADVARINKGLLTHDRYYDQLGLNAFDELKAQADLIAKLQSYCKEVGVDFNLVVAPQQGMPLPENEEKPKEENTEVAGEEGAPAEDKEDREAVSDD